jgi:hypothetical protein
MVALGSIISVILSNVNAVGSSSWKETGTDFQKGEFVNTFSDSNGVSLQISNQTNKNWTKISDGVPWGLDGGFMTYDSLNDVIVFLPSGRCETWIYDFKTDYWTKKNPVITPGTQNWPAMAYDSHNGRVVLFNGETWAYDIFNDTWINMSPTISPPVDSSIAMVYENTTGVLVLFGGMKNGSLMNETWTYNLNTNSWTNMLPAESPPARKEHAMAYDAVRARTILYGGSNGNFLNDTWTYDLSRNTWTNMSPETAPSPRGLHNLVYDSHSDEVVLFGGRDYDQNLGDTWTYYVGTNTWRDTNSLGPSPRALAAATYDMVEKRVVLYGGWSGDESLSYTIWTYSVGFNLWWANTTTNIPSPRAYFAMAYAPVFNEVVLFGGTDDYGKYHRMNDTYVFNLSTKIWSNKNPKSAPPAQASQTMVFDIANEEMILFGIEETWTYNFSNNIWTNKNPQNVPIISGQGIAYDSNDGVIILFGNNGTNPETWTYNVSTNYWTNMKPRTSPPLLWDPAMSYDSNTGEVVLFGGSTWTYNLYTNNWTMKNTATAPSASNGYAMAYDSANRVMVLFGGYNKGGPETMNETWTYNATNNTWMKIHTEITPENRTGQGMLYDSKRGKILLFGGEEYWGISFKSDLWEYDLQQLCDTGTYTSAPFDTGGLAYYGNIQWTGSISPGTTISIQLRTADTIKNLTVSQFVGPDATGLSFYNDSGSKINSIHNGSRWIQYRAILGSNGSSDSPLLKSVTINYNLIHSLEITNPLGDEKWTGYHNITWSARDSDNDSLSFDIILETGSISTILAAGLPNDTREWLWNTSQFPNGTYRVRIVARDDNPSIPLTINATSGNFTIQHPIPQPPFHPPRVSLIAPANNSYISNNSVRLLWNGTDPNGDSLIYTIYFSDQPIVTEKARRNMSLNDYLDLDNLKDNITYYWAVDAWDGRNNCTDFPAELWSFTIKLPPANIPVRINSTPPSQAWVGKELIYNITTIDEDGDTPNFSLISGPKNLSLDPTTGTLHWIPGSSDIGNQTITIQVSDGRGSTDRQTFIVTVLEIPGPPPPTKPSCRIVSPVNGSKVFGKIQIHGTAINGSAQLSIIQVRIDGGEWSNAIGLENWTFLLDTSRMKNGPHTMEARAFAGNLYSETVSREIVINNPNMNVTISEYPWYLSFIIAGIIIGIILSFLRWKIRK